jgi:hypothetical protein
LFSYPRVACCWQENAVQPRPVAHSRSHWLAAELVALSVVALSVVACADRRAEPNASCDHCEEAPVVAPGTEIVVSTTWDETCYEHSGGVVDNEKYAYTCNEQPFDVRVYTDLEHSLEVIATEFWEDHLLGKAALVLTPEEAGDLYWGVFMTNAKTAEQVRIPLPAMDVVQPEALIVDCIYASSDVDERPCEHTESPDGDATVSLHVWAQAGDVAIHLMPELAITGTQRQPSCGVNVDADSYASGAVYGCSVYLTAGDAPDIVASWEDLTTTLPLAVD